MAEYIDREDYCRNRCRCDEKRCIRAICPIWKAPKADVAPVRHGRWITTAYTTISKRGRITQNVKYTCSECKRGNGRKRSNYCPNCGARMDGGTENG